MVLVYFQVSVLTILSSIHSVPQKKSHQVLISLPGVLHLALEPELWNHLLRNLLGVLASFLCKVICHAPVLTHPNTFTRVW